MSSGKIIKDFLHKDIIDIQLLLCLALKQKKEQLFANPSYELTKKELTKLKKLIKDRNNGKPYAYLSGSQGFYHLDFQVSSDTLIPRPETELLIDIAIDLFKPNQLIDAIDLGTGSGIIAITLADKCPAWRISASDKSINALKIAKKNATKDIKFYHSSWFDELTGKTFDLIVTNPPYLAENDSHLEDLKYEPIEAMVSGKDGLDDIREIIKNAPNYLNEGGYLLLEHSDRKQKEIVELLKDSFINIKTYQDLNGLDRAILAELR
ncbi:MAG: peptide chain release factor N(5)-glutamine methyltransferase [Pseudomonadota bacterium]|nr:peptide chain release factor N(5)-glutamine methyltransferase [Pseudomonadota bacterium]